MDGHSREWICNNISGFVHLYRTSKFHWLHCPGSDTGPCSSGWSCVLVKKAMVSLLCPFLLLSLFPYLDSSLQSCLLGSPSQSPHSLFSILTSTLCWMTSILALNASFQDTPWPSTQSSALKWELSSPKAQGITGGDIVMISSNLCTWLLLLLMFNDQVLITDKLNVSWVAVLTYAMLFQNMNLKFQWNGLQVTSPCSVTSGSSGPFQLPLPHGVVSDPPVGKFPSLVWTFVTTLFSLVTP